MKVAIVHDDLVQWGGAERVLVAISEVFPEAEIFTSIYDKNHPILSQKFKNKKINTSFMEKIPLYKNLYKALLPIYPVAFEQFDFTGFDLVLSQTTRFAKSVITKPETRHICYCHTPARFLWNFSLKSPNKRDNPYFDWLRFYDKISSERVDYFLAGSLNAKNRIKQIYNKDAKILYPFVDDIFFNNKQVFDGGYYLLVARLNIYKNVDVVIKAFNKLGMPLTIVGVGPELGRLQRLTVNPKIRFLTNVSEEILVNLISGCKALIVSGEEDFGLTSLEAQAMGKPVVGYGIGGVLETVKNNKTGILYPNQSVEDIISAIEKLAKTNIKASDCIDNAKAFSKHNFKIRLEQYIKELLS